MNNKVITNFPLIRCNINNNEYTNQFRKVVRRQINRPVFPGFSRKPLQVVCLNNKNNKLKNKRNVTTRAMPIETLAMTIGMESEFNYFMSVFLMNLTFVVMPMTILGRLIQMSWREISYSIIAVFVFRSIVILVESAHLFK
jgi:hypothetical protein